MDVQLSSFGFLISAPTIFTLSLILIYLIKADDGEYDLWGDEQSMIHERAKRQSEIVVTATCVDCYQELIETRDAFIVR